MNATLASIGKELADVGETAELRLVPPRFGPGRQRFAHLGDHHPDVVGWDLDPRVALHLVDRPQLKAGPGHQQVGLEAGLAVQSHQLVSVLLTANTFGDQADLGRADRVKA